MKINMKSRNRFKIVCMINRLNGCPQVPKWPFVHDVPGESIEGSKGFVDFKIGSPIQKWAQATDKKFFIIYIHMHRHLYLCLSVCFPLSLSLSASLSLTPPPHTTIWGVMLCHPKNQRLSNKSPSSRHEGPFKLLVREVVGRLPKQCRILVVHLVSSQKLKVSIFCSSDTMHLGQGILRIATRYDLTVSYLETSFHHTRSWYARC